jgi:hypothetical protein
MTYVWKRSESLVRFSVVTIFIPLSQGWKTKGTRAQNDTRHSLLSRFSLFILPDQRLYAVKNIYIYIYLTAYRLYMNNRFYQITHPVRHFCSVSLVASRRTLCSTVQLCAAVPCHSVDITGPTPFSTLVLYSSQLFPLPVWLPSRSVELFLVLVTCRYWLLGLFFFFFLKYLDVLLTNDVSHESRLCSASHRGSDCSYFLSESPPFCNCSHKPPHGCFCLCLSSHNSLCGRSTLRVITHL